MSVKILSTKSKVQLIKFYQSKTFTQKELSRYFNVSERTVNRVLIEVGIATPVARLKGEAYRIMDLLKRAKLDYAGLQNLLSTANAI